MVWLSAIAQGQTNEEKATAHYELAKVAFNAKYESHEEFVSGMERASDEINQSLQLDQTNPDAFLLRGNLYAMTKRWDKVVECMDFALRLDNTNSEYFMKRGMAKNILKDHVNALIDLNMAIDNRPDCGECWFNRGMLYYGQAMDDEACRDFNEAVKLGYSKALSAVNKYCGEQ